jgi:hypothetical protein
LKQRSEKDSSRYQGWVHCQHIAKSGKWLRLLPSTFWEMGRLVGDLIYYPPIFAGQLWSEKK